MYYGSRVLTSNYDSYGRPTGYSFNGASTVSATIGYDAASGRPNTVAGALGTTSASFALAYATGTDWVKTVTSGSYTRSTPLRSDASFGYKYDVIHSATTQWGTTTLAAFKAQYETARGLRIGQDSGSTSGMPATSWTKILNLGDGYKSGTGGYDGFGQFLGTGTPAWQATAGTQNLALRTLTWTYDTAGNRRTEADGLVGTTNYSTTASNPNAAGSLNQYETITGGRGEATLAYDADGNLTQDGTWTYTYDAENRLKTATKSGQSLTFVYDYLGRRIAKTVGSSTTTFLWNGWTLAADLGSDGVTPQRVYVRGRDFSDAHGAAGGAGALLAQISGSTVAYAVPDALGNIVGYLTGGSFALAVEYSPYGKGLNAYGSTAGYPIGFAGQYMDWEMGIVYYGLRYYQPKHGRFMTRDPIEEAGGVNLYAFVGNAPLNFRDLLGLRICYTVRRETAVSRDGGADSYPYYEEICVPGAPWENGFGNSTTVWQNPLGDDSKASFHPSRGSSTSLLNLVADIVDRLIAPNTARDRTPQFDYGEPIIIGTVDDFKIAPNSLAQAQAVAAQLGWNGFATNLSESQQLYYGKTAADILALQAQGKDVSGLWKAVVGEVPGVITDSNGNMAGDSADMARATFLLGVGALGAVLPSNLGDTLNRISNGESFPHRNDGAVFQNREGLLPRQQPGYYREYVNPTPGTAGPDAQRVIVGQGGEVYYTPDHYRTFVRVPSGGGGQKPPGTPGGG